MLEAIARRRLSHRPVHRRRTWCTSRSAAASTAARGRRRAAAALRGGRGGARRDVADLLRVHDAGHPAAVRAGPARRGDPRGRSRRPARRGQRRRRRLRDHHQHRPRPHRVPRAATASRSAARRPTSSAPAGRRSSATRCRRSVLDHAERIGADLWRVGPRLQLPGDRQQWTWSGAAALSTGWPIRRCAAPTSCSTPPARWPRSRRCASACRSRAGGAQRPGDGRAARPLPDRAGAAGAGARRGAQPARGRRAGAQPRPDGLLSRARMPCSACMRDKDIAGVVGKLGDRIDHWHVGPTPGPRGTSAAQTAAQLRAASVGMASGQSITEHATLADAYAAARGSAAADDRILAFGSFLTVADVMRAIRTHVRSGP